MSRRNHDPVFQKAFRLISIGELGRAGRLIANNPAIDFFLRRDVGIRVLMVLMQEVRGQKDRRTPSGFYSAAARRCHVSRNHVRNLLEEAEAMGLVSLSDVRGRYVEVLPALDQAVDRWVAEALEGMDRSTKLALAHLEQQAA
jgi:plasmid maintenance system antidote protein VapI